MVDLDRALDPIVKHVWEGKTLLFSILLDPTFKTWSSVRQLCKGLPFASRVCAGGKA